MSLADELLEDLQFLDDEDVKPDLPSITEEFSDEESMALDTAIKEEDDELDLSKIIIKELSDVKKLARLVSSESLSDVLQRIDSYPAAPTLNPSVTNVEQDPEYRLVVEANALNAELDQEILLVNKFIREHYRTKFPELETLIRNPLDYAKTVNLIGNNMNIVKIDFTSILPSASIMVVKTAATTTRGQPLPEKELALVLKACEMALTLESAKRKIFDYVQSRMSLFAPNLSAFIGTQTAARLIGAKGGLEGLARTPSSNLASLGAKRALGTGFAVTYAEGAQGFLYQSELVRNTAPDYRKQAQRIAAGKIVLLARIDEQRSSPDGSEGRKALAEVELRLRKLQTPPEHRGPRALPAPLEPPSKKRGGKRVRRMKERNALTEMRKLQNRVKFGEAEAEVDFGDESEGLGMLTQSGSVRAFTVDKRTKAKIGKKTQARLAQISGIKTSIGGKETSGLQSSLTFTPVQGIELVNPSLNQAARQALLAQEKDKWFQGGTFTQIQKAPSKMLPPPLPVKK